MNVKEMKDETVFDEIYVLKGIAIIGLIIWHTYHTPLPLINPSFSNFLWKIIAQYAMPLFMFASGFLFGFSKKEISSLASYSDFVKTKFKRLVIPYFAVWGIYIAAEFAAEFLSGFTSINYSVNPDFWKFILFNPIKGTALHLWFLHQLFIVFLIFPILNKIIRNDIILLILVCAMWLFPRPDSEIFDLVNLRVFLLFFSFGYLYSHCEFDKINNYAKSLCLITLVLFVVYSFKLHSIADYFDAFKINSDKLYVFLGMIKKLLAVVFYYFLSVVIKRYKNTAGYILEYLGVYSLAIYLFHHISLGVVRYAFINVLDLNESLRVIASIIVFLSGMILPVLFAKYFISRFRILPPLLLGIKKVPHFRGI